MPRRKKSTPIQFKLRVRDELRERLAAAAKARGVSVNAEAVERLEQSFERENKIKMEALLDLAREQLVLAKTMRAESALLMRKALALEESEGVQGLLADVFGDELKAEPKWVRPDPSEQLLEEVSNALAHRMASLGKTEDAADHRDAAREMILAVWDGRPSGVPDRGLQARILAHDPVALRSRQIAREIASAFSRRRAREPMKELADLIAEDPFHDPAATKDPTKAALEAIEDALASVARAPQAGLNASIEKLSADVDRVLRRASGKTEIAEPSSMKQLEERIKSHIDAPGAMENAPEEAEPATSKKTKRA